MRPNSLASFEVIALRHQACGDAAEAHLLLLLLGKWKWVNLVRVEPKPDPPNPGIHQLWGGRGIITTVHLN